MEVNVIDTAATTHKDDVHFSAPLCPSDCTKFRVCDDNAASVSCETTAQKPVGSSKTPFMSCCLRINFGGRKL